MFAFIQDISILLLLFRRVRLLFFNNATKKTLMTMRSDVMMKANYDIICNDICKWLDVLVFSNKDDKQ